MNPSLGLALEAHPIAVLKAIVARYGAELRLTFSRYEIGPPGDQERRRRATFEIDAGRTTEAWLQNELRRLGQDEELALHSHVSRGRVGFHFLMVDYEQNCSLSLVRDLGLSVLGETSLAPSVTRGQPLSLYSFETGRSYHQYADVLIHESDWHHHLGSLLLLNRPCEPPIVDVRWIAHALRRGYAALRWSQNTTRYLSTPRLVDQSTAEDHQPT
jgi:hypothetical protein